jgi:site-specific DNA recombinase
MEGQVVLFLRFSSRNQREESLRAQELKCRQLLDQLGIDHSNALVLRGVAERGDRDDRADYELIRKMIADRTLAVLCSDEQSRFSRGFRVDALVQDLVYAGGRFVTAMEGIDTNRQGWENLVGFKQLANRMEIKNTGWRVRRCQEERVDTDDGSAGDRPYGYTSVYVDPAAARAYAGRGAKPKKRIVIDDQAAAVVREIFDRCRRCESIASIVRWWESIKHTVPPITKTVIRLSHVMRILQNEKYIGHWRYGKTTTLHDSDGNKKQIRHLPTQQVTYRHRPQFRIVEQAVWDATRPILAKLKETYGFRLGQKRRGPRVHYTELYPTELIAGLVYCAHCGKVLNVMTGGRVKRLGCQSHRAGVCSAVARVPYAAAETAVLRIVEQVLLHYPDWLHAVADYLRQELSKTTGAVPADLAVARSRFAELEQQIGNATIAITQGLNSPALKKRLSGLETEQYAVGNRIRELEESMRAGTAMPDDAWIADQLRGLQSVLKDEMKLSARMLQEMIGRIDAEQVSIPGKKRGYTRLRFRIRGWEGLRHLLAGKMPAAVLDALKPTDPTLGVSEEFVIELGEPTNMDKWAPKIAAWREQKVKWKEIADRTGLTMGNAWAAYKRFKNASDSATVPSDDAGPESEDDNNMAA